MPEDTYLTVKDISQKLQVSVDTVRRWLEVGNFNLSISVTSIVFRQQTWMLFSLNTANNHHLKSPKKASRLIMLCNTATVCYTGLDKFML